MDHIKSYILNVLMLFTVLFSYTSCGPKRSPYEECKYGVNMYHGLNKSLVECAAHAIRNYQQKAILHEVPYTKDVNDYYWKMHELLSAENILTIDDFCMNLEDNEIKGGLFAIPNPNYIDCADALKSFNDFIPLITVEDEGIVSQVIPYHLDGSELPIYMINFEDPTKDEELKKYKQGINFQNLPNIHMGGKYGAVFLEVMAGRVRLIGFDLTPLDFCNQRHTTLAQSSSTPWQ